MSDIIGDAPCPKCRERGADKTGNHLILFENGNKYCNRCGYKGDIVYSKETLEDIKKLPTSALEDRGTNKKVSKFFGVRVGHSEDTGEVDKHYYPYYRDGKLTGYKVRNIKDKSFYSVGDIKGTELFGQNECKRMSNSNKFLLLVEGECDALAAKQMLVQEGKGFYKVASLANGASVSCVKKNFEWLDSFENIALALDQDEPGKKATESICTMFTPGKVKVVSLPEKDPNEMLKKGQSSQFLKAISGAHVKRPDGIVSGKETWKLLIDKPNTVCVPFPTEWSKMNKMTYGIRRGELDTFCSGSGMGKTSVFKELQYHIFNSTPENVGIIALEEPITDSVEDLMALYLNKRIRLPDVREKVTDELMREAWERTMGTDRFHFYDHFGSVSDDSLVSKIRFLNKGLGCNYIFLDHLSIVVSEFAAEGGERERIDTIMTKLKNLTQELDIWLGIIVHLRKTQNGKSFEEGAVPTLDDLRGSGSLKQLSNSVYALSRNQQDADKVKKDTSLMHVLKCRFTGRTGKADYLFYNQDTGRMTKTELDNQEEDAF